MRGIRCKASESGTRRPPPPAAQNAGTRAGTLQHLQLLSLAAAHQDARRRQGDVQGRKPVRVPVLRLVQALARIEADLGMRMLVRTS